MTDPPVAPGVERPLLRRALAVAVGASVALALASLPSRAGHLVGLWSSPGTLARGVRAADERRSPYATSGQVGWRRSLERGAESSAPRPSGLALAWSFFAESAPLLPPRSRVYLARPNDALYMYGNFLLSPSRLEVAPAPGRPLADGADLAAVSTRRSCRERDRLRAEGYAACVDVEGRDLRLHLLGPGQP